MRTRACHRLGVILLMLGIAGCSSSTESPPEAKPNTTIQKTPVVIAPDDPNMPLFGHGFLDESGYPLAYGYTAPIDDRSSLEQVYAASEGRSKRGKAAIERQIEQIRASNMPPERKAEQLALQRTLIGLLAMYDADFREADRLFTQALDENPGISDRLRDNIAVLRGVAWLRRGELDNCVACVGPSSCIFPLAREAIHLNKAGSTKAIEHFNAYLKKRPEDLGVRWLLNVAHMTLGTYPEQVPTDQLIPLDRFRSKRDIGRFANVAGLVGLDTRGPNMSGGNIFDDFNNDGLPDLFVISTDWVMDASMYINKGDGTFEDQGQSWNLGGQRMALNVAHADFDNDGHLDVLVLRGGWETPYRLSLLRNTGQGRFEDITKAAGLDLPIATQAGAWADFDNDGWLDLYVGGEFQTNVFEPRNRGRLYRNNRNGTFTDIAEKAGVENERWAKGATWGDYDNDGDQDLYVSNMNDANRLYRNNGNGTFTDVAPELGLTDPLRSFACWFWDYDNDGHLDLFVTGFGAWIDDVVADMIGAPTQADRPRLYRNLGNGKFADQTKQAGLYRVLLPMGSNFGDVDNDGYLDVYLGTGRPPYSHIVPNVMLSNREGKTFEDVTESSGTGHLQKGHGVSFADWDQDGDLDLFIAAGGTTPGDRAHNILFQNPGHGNHWIKLKLVGTRSNRSAIGARVSVEFDDPKLGARTVHRVINGGSSFGGNSLVASIGLGKAETVKRVTIQWPTGQTVQTFTGLQADRVYEITEGASAFKTMTPRPLPQPRPVDPPKVAVTKD